MNILEEIVKNLTTQEIRFYKILANRTHKKERKDLRLFNLIRKELYKEEKACLALSEGKKNNFYQLKNTLVENINKSLTLQHAHIDKEVSISHLILLAKIYERKGKLKFSFHYLKKAEKEAVIIEDFELLSKIYTNILKLSYELISINVEKYIQRKKENQERLKLAQETDIALASVMYKIKTSQNFSNKNKKVLKILNETLDSLRSNKRMANSSTFKINIFKVVSRVLLQQNNFIALEEYLQNTLKEFREEKIFNKETHEEKLMLLTYLANCLYKNRKFKSSLGIGKELKTSMNQYEGFLRDKYLFYYYNTLVVNYSEIDKEKAKKVLLEAKNNKTIQKLPTFGVFIYLNRALIEYQQKKYKLAVKSISRLILQEDFIDLDELLQLKIHISEIMIRYKLNQTERIELKIEKIKKTYKKHLSSHGRDNKFISIIKQLIYCHNLNNDTRLKEEIRNIIEATPDKSAINTDIINYNEWLRSLNR